MTKSLQSCDQDSASCDHKDSHMTKSLQSRKDKDSHMTKILQSHDHHMTNLGEARCIGDTPNDLKEHGNPIIRQDEGGESL